MENLLIGNINNFKKYSQFKSLKDFNNNFEQWMIEYKHMFTWLELICLKRLVRYSAKVPGVASVKINVILEAIMKHDFEHGASRSTFKRMLSKAKRIGLLEVKQIFRKNQSKSSNLYIFRRFNTIGPCQTEGEQVEAVAKQQIIVSENNVIEPSYKTNNLIKTSKIINKRIDTLDYTFTLEYVPKQFRDLARCFFNDAKVIEEYWKMVQIVAYKNNEDHDRETMLEISINAFKQMINKLKKGKVDNPFAYFTAILKRKYEDIYFAELHEIGVAGTCSNVTKYNWLDA